MIERGEGEREASGSRRLALASASLSLTPSPRRPVSPRSSSGGWTLIELVITVTILTILSLGVVPLVQTSVRRAREQQLRESLRDMRRAIEEFHRDTIGATCCMNPPPPPPVPLIDPRSRVGISDATIFGVENLDRYPPTLEILVEGVNVLPRAATVNRDGGGGGGGGAGGALISTKKKVYLRSIPVDPMTGKAEWNLRSSYDAADASEWGGENVFDVRSKSEATALDGSKYSEW